MAVKNNKYKEPQLDSAAVKALNTHWNDGVGGAKKAAPKKSKSAATNKKKTPTKSKK